jgi:hypothetical protein
MSGGARSRGDLGPGARQPGRLTAMGPRPGAGQPRRLLAPGPSKAHGWAVAGPEMDLVRGAACAGPSLTH